MPLRNKGGRPKNTADNAYQGLPQRHPDQVEDEAEREIALMLDRSKRAVEQAQEVEQRKRRQRLETITVAAQALKALDHGRGNQRKQSEVARFIAEFSGVGSRHVETILAAGSASPPAPEDD